MFTDEQIAQLNTDLDPRHIKAKQGRDYVEGWHVIAEANRIFGHGNWSRETISMDQLFAGPNPAEGKTNYYAAYMAKVEIPVYVESNGTRHCILRQGTGHGEGYGPTLGQAIESAAKEAETDAMKRALVTFGWPFGLALYQKPQEREHVASANGPPAGGAPPQAPPATPQLSPEEQQEAFFEAAGKVCDELSSLGELGTAALEEILSEWNGLLTAIPDSQRRPVYRALQAELQRLNRPGEQTLGL